MKLRSNNKLTELRSGKKYDLSKTEKRAINKHTRNKKIKEISSNDGIKEISSNDGIKEISRNERQFDTEALLDKIDKLQEDKVKKVFEMTIGYLENDLHECQKQLGLSSTQDQIRKHSDEKRPYSPAIERLAKLEKKYFKKGEIEEYKREEAIKEIRVTMKNIVKEGESASIKTTEALQKVIDSPTQYERDVRYLGDNTRVIITTQREREGSPKRCELRCVKWDPHTETLRTIFDHSYLDSVRDKGKDYMAPDGKKSVEIREIHEGEAWSNEISFAGCVILANAGNDAGTLQRGMEEFWVCEKGDLTVCLKNPETNEERKFKVGPGDHFSVPPKHEYQVYNHSSEPANILLANVPGWSGPQDWSPVKESLLDSQGNPKSGPIEDDSPS